ncbi:MAG: class II glutamine amidotransferase [Lachnospiraceae bacterium]|nr:class II glutamine amidotransferase [Lachnospiraceae bacterium]
MCELFGFCSEKEQNLSGYLTEFFSHSVNHPNGWGYARVDDGKTKVYLEALPAYESADITEAIDNGRAAKVFLGHIRKATIGGIKTLNCHPFVAEDNYGNEWILIHNGTIFSGKELISYESRQSGDTDSERIFLYMLDRINMAAEAKGSDLNSFERFKVIENVISVLSYRNKLNLIIYDGRQMYVHANMRGTLYSKVLGEGICFATVALDDEGWKPVLLNTLFVYDKGVLKYVGRNHHNEYINTIELIGDKVDYTI